MSSLLENQKDKWVFCSPPTVLELVVELRASDVVVGVESREVGMSRGGPTELKLAVADIDVDIVVSTE